MDNNTHVCSFEEQYTKVKTLMHQIREAKEVLRVLEEELAYEKNALQNACSHQFVLEDDGDYHRPTYYQVCTTCSFTQPYIPKRR
jgi:hypothetical protein